MKLYATSSEKIDILKDEWFLPTLPDEFEVIIKQLPQTGSSVYGDESFHKMLYQRCGFVLDIIKENMGEVFVYGEVDMQFFRPMKKALLTHLGSNDVVFQNNSTPPKAINAGLWICRGSENLLTLWSAAMKFLEREIMYDENAINLMLRTSPPEEYPEFITKEESEKINSLKWDYLPNEYFVPKLGFIEEPPPEDASLPQTEPEWGYLWKPGRPLNVPRNIIMHHANWTIGLDNKIAQLKYVRNAMKQRLHDPRTWRRPFKRVGSGRASIVT